MNRALRVRAVKLRRAGWSYNIISERLGVSKSTLSIWLRSIPFQPNKVVQRRVNNALLKSVMFSHTMKLRSLREAQLFAHRWISELSQRDLMMIGLGLFIGEGSKNEETIHVANSDPAVLRFTAKWLRESFNIPISHFRVVMHLYPDNSERAARRYWSRAIGVPSTQFEKTQFDRRLNKSLVNRRKLPHGTAHLKVRACGNSDFGVLLHRRVMALINEIYTQTRV